MSAVADAVDLSPYVRPAADGASRMEAMVDGMHCAGCAQRIERALAARPEVREARVNVTARKLAVTWDGGDGLAPALVDEVERLGFRVMPFDSEQMDSAGAARERALLRAMAVAGFAAGNIMLLSISVWAGYFQGMGPATRDLMHWFSALIALPAVAYAGRPFFSSAVTALRSRSMNMDVPISLAVLLATGMSLAETLRSAQHVYFDSATALLFFLLVGRFLDARARGRARSAAERLLALGAAAVRILDDDGSSRMVPPQAVRQGDQVLIAAGERVPVDGTVETGESDIDTALISGESVPTAAAPGTRVFAGTLNLTGSLRLRVDAVGDGTLLAEIARLMDAAEQRRARHVVLADRLVRVYSPAVHLLAAGTFLGWWLLGGAGWQDSLLIAVAVLIITCPCALALAVPVVQVVASNRLFRQGILLKSATALERIAAIDTVAFDKTGTLTRGKPVLRDGAGHPALPAAAALALASRHPLARALAEAAPATAPADRVEEVPGRGLRRPCEDGTEERLGSAAWCGVEDAPPADGPELWYAPAEGAPVRFRFEDALRDDAAQVVAALRDAGLDVLLLSGDRAATVTATAEAVGITDAAAELSPADKVARLEELAAEGRRVCMVGDGLNDAPALAAAFTSMSPAGAADISQTAADLVFQGERLAPVLEARRTARRAARLVRQNFGLALGYNLFTVPLACAGYVTPLIAAIAMSSSSLVVIGNALRLGRSGR